MKRFCLFFIFLINFLFFDVNFSIQAVTNSKYFAFESVEIVSNTNHTLTVHFHLDTQFLEPYIENQILELETYQPNNSWDIENYKAMLNIVLDGGPIVNVWVIGDFNNWEPFRSQIPNTLFQDDEQTNLYSTAELIEIPLNDKDEFYYRFVIDYANYSDQSIYLYLEDPLAANTNFGLGTYVSIYQLSNATTTYEWSMLLEEVVILMGKYEKAKENGQISAELESRYKITLKEMVKIMTEIMERDPDEFVIFMGEFERLSGYLISQE